MNKKEVIAEVIEELHHLNLQERYWINYGGCGVFASTVGEELEKRGFDVGITYHHTDAYRINEIEEAYEMREPSSAGHVIVRAEGITFDAETDDRNGEYWGMLEHPRYGVRVDLEYAKMSADNPDCGWNDDFRWNKKETVKYEIISTIRDVLERNGLL